MTRKDKVWIGVLCAAACVIWLRDRSWMEAAPDTIPILAGLPLLFALGRPWQLRKEPFKLGTGPLLAGIGLWIVGMLSNLTVLLALGWTAAFWAWAGTRLESSRRRDVFRLLVLPVLAFPWVTLDAAVVGWWFRLSAAAVAEICFRVVGLSVTRQGTMLHVQNLPISVEAACSGMKVLQAMLIAGSVLAWTMLVRSRLYWWSLPVLVVLAWIANTIRVLTLSVAALSAGPEFASGLFHTWGGWLVLVLMFLLSGGCLSLLKRIEGMKPVAA